MTSLKSFIGENEEAKKIFRDLKFTEGVINGRIAVLEPDETADRRAKAKKAANKAILNMNMSNKAAKRQEFKNYVNTISKKSHK